jgi:hypothetical protein
MYESAVNRTTAAAVATRNAVAESSHAAARRSSTLPSRVEIHGASAESDSSVDTCEASTDEEGPIGPDDYVPDEELPLVTVEMARRSMRAARVWAKRRRSNKELEDLLQEGLQTSAPMKVIVLDD